MDRPSSLVSCLVFDCLVLSCLVLSCLVLSCLVLPCLLPGRVLSCLVLSCPVLSCLVLFYFVLSCPIFIFVSSLSCLVLSCLVVSGRVVSCVWVRQTKPNKTETCPGAVDSEVHEYARNLWREQPGLRTDRDNRRASVLVLECDNTPSNPKHPPVLKMRRRVVGVYIQIQRRCFQEDVCV